MLSTIHGEDPIDNLLNRLFGEFDKGEGGSKGLAESRQEGLFQIVSRDFLSQLSI